MKNTLLILTLVLTTPLLAADPAQNPIYLDCHSGCVVIYPGGTNVTWEALQLPDNPVTQLLDQIQAHTESKYLVILARPQSVKLFNAVLTLALRCPVDIDVAYEAVDANAIIDDQHLPKISKPERQPATCSGSMMRQFIDQQFIGMHPVLFECRQNEVFYIDKDGFDVQVEKLMWAGPTTIKKQDRRTHEADVKAFQAEVNSAVITNEYYKVVPKYLLMMTMALEPQVNVHGESPEQFNQSGSKFQTTLAHLDPKTQYIGFVIRDDGFKAYHLARTIAEKRGFKIDLRLVETGEPIMLGFKIPEIP